MSICKQQGPLGLSVLRVPWVTVNKQCRGSQGGLKALGSFPQGPPLNAGGANQADPAAGSPLSKPLRVGVQAGLGACTTQWGAYFQCPGGVLEVPSSLMAASYTQRSLDSMENPKFESWPISPICMREWGGSAPRYQACLSRPSGP